MTHKYTMKSFRLIAITLMAFISICAFSQEVDEDEMLKRRAAEKVAQQNDYISFMASKRKTTSIRYKYKNKALNLFVGKGYSYVENSINKEGVQQEISSRRNGRVSVRSRLTRDYFDALIKMGYSDVVINSTEIANMKVSNLQQIDDNTFVCTCEYDQAFSGYRDGKPIYQDITTKRIKCYVYREDTEDGYEYIVKLGDNYVEETRPYK